MKNQSKPSHSSSRETPSASDTFFAVSKRIVCGSRARFGLGVLSHASKAQKYETELIPTLARRSCCDNPARSRIARKVIRVPPCCFPSVRSIKQNAPTEAEAFCDIKTCLICIFDPRMLHIISIHALRIEPKVFQPDTRHSGATEPLYHISLGSGVRLDGFIYNRLGNVITVLDPPCRRRFVGDQGGDGIAVG